MKKLLCALVVGAAFFVATPALAANGTITGTITHNNGGTPISSLYVYVQNVSNGVATAAYTDNDGVYSVSVAPGTYDINPSTYTSDEPSRYFIEKSKTATVTSGNTTTKNFALTRRGRFTGHVYASDGVTELSDASLYFSNSGGNVNGYSYAWTTSNGKYYSTPIPGDGTESAAGTYTVTVARAGYFSLSVSNVVLPGDEQTVTKNFKLTPKSIVSGVIRNASGDTLSGATVTLTKSNGYAYGATTNATGGYSVSIYDTWPYNGTAVGDYTMSISAAGYVTKTDDISITADASRLTGRNVSLNKAGKITGMIKKSNGQPLSGVTVTADDGFGHTYTATTGSNGKYTLERLKPSASYTVTATRTYYVGQKLYQVSVAAGKTTSGKNLILPAAVVFSGTVRSKIGEAPLDNAVVYLFKRSKARSEIADYAFTTKGNGKFTFRNVSPGDYRLKIILNGYITLTKELVVLNSNTNDKKYLLDRGGTIYGRVVANSKGVSGATVEVYAPNSGQEIAYTSAVTDEKGYYVVRSLKTGAYRLRVNSTKYITQVVTAKVVAGRPTGSVVTLARAGSVSGYLTDRVTGLPVSALMKVVNTTTSAWADANGYYVLDGIAPGVRRITAISAYYDVPSQREVTVTIGNIVKNVNFSLNPKQ